LEQTLEANIAHDFRNSPHTALGSAIKSPLPADRGEGRYDWDEYSDNIAGRTNAFDALISLYDNSREPEIKQHLLDYIGSSRDPRAPDKLFSIAQSDPDRELRRHAVDYVAGR
jgi:hypothetical protein